MRGETWWWLAAFGLLVVTGGAVYAEAYSKGKPIGRIRLVNVPGADSAGHPIQVPMEAATASAFLAMQASAAQAGVKLVPSSGFRSYAEQAALWAEHEDGTRTTPVARPGHSNHESGIAVDIHVSGNNPGSPEYQWLADNAANFGFVNTGATFNPPEWWHWERTS